MNQTYFRTLNALIALIFMINISYAQTRLEGLLYLDKKPVSVEIKDGKIINVQPIENLSDPNHPVYIAPGLIDIQINGFMGVDFAGQNLNTEDIRKAVKALWEHGVTHSFRRDYSRP